MPLVNLHFPLIGSTLPFDHGYALYSVLSQLVPALHRKESRTPRPGSRPPHG